VGGGLMAQTTNQPGHRGLKSQIFAYVAEASIHNI